MTQTKEKAFQALFVTDFDGTLYFGGDIHPGDRRVLEDLGKAKVLRAIATGRSLKSYRGVADAMDLPVDYLVFSSGAGLMNLATGTVEAAKTLKAEDVLTVARVLESLGLDYMIHEPIPKNHRFLYRSKDPQNTDFLQRCRLYHEYCAPLEDRHLEAPDEATQFIAILRPGQEGLEALRRELAEYSVVRTTSPLDGKSTWVEIFSRGISKSTGVAALCERYGISPRRVCAVGNDYNDMDLLEWAAWSFVPSTAPGELRSVFRIIPEDQGAALAGAARLWLGQLKRPITGSI
ncbi:MAG: HAD family phosphatase [Spirochaetales bacterium]|nr:HAD family phosphatase [Spirochaetales bacterium]